MALDRNKILDAPCRLRQSLNRRSQWNKPEKVHSLRTQTRRLEAIVYVLSGNEKQISRPLLKEATRIFRYAGKVRDMDVITASATGLDIDPHDPCLIHLIKHLHARRRKAAVELRSCVSERGKQARRLLKQYSSWLQNNKSSNFRRWQTKASAIALQLVVELSGWPPLSDADLHPYRLKIKALRYTLQLAQGKEAPFLGALVQVTDAIGEWHDWNKLLDIAVRHHSQSKGCAVCEAIRSTTSDKRRLALSRANNLRTKYLSGLGAAQQELQPSLSKSALEAISHLGSRQPANRANARSRPLVATPLLAPASL